MEETCFPPLNPVVDKFLDSGDAKRYILLTNISLEPTDAEDVRFTSATEIRTHGLPDSDADERRFALERTEEGEGRWVLRGCIEVPASMDALNMSLMNEGRDSVCNMRITLDKAGWRHTLTETQHKTAKETSREVTVHRNIETEGGPPVKITLTENYMEYEEIAEFLGELGYTVYMRFQDTDKLSDINEAIGYEQRALDITPPDHPDLAERMANLGSSLHARFQRSDELADLTKAISLDQAALDITPEDHPELPNRLANLGATLYSRFQRNGDSADLTKAIVLEQRALDMTPEGHPGLSYRITTLGLSLQARYQRSGDLADITRAISLNKRALDITPPGDSELPYRLCHLANAFYIRFKGVGMVSDLTEAIEVSQKAIGVMSDEHPELPQVLNLLGLSFHALFSRNGAPSDLTKAIYLNEKALEITPDGHPELACRLESLGATIHARFQLNGDLSDVSEAISLYQKALEITPVGHPELAQRLTHLGVSLHARFQRTDELPDLKKAILSTQEALKLTPDDHPDLAQRLDSLGSSYHSLSQRTGELENLKKAIALKRKSLEITPDPHPDLARRLANLGSSLYTHFEHTGELDELNEAISLEQRALDITPERHPDLAKRLDSLAASLHVRFQRNGELADLTTAIALQQRALESTPASQHPDLARRLANLGAFFHSRYQRSDELSDLTESIALTRRALDIMPDDHPDLAHRLDSLGAAFDTLFQRSNALSDITDAISFHEQALDITPDDHPQRARRLVMLGASYSARYLKNKELDDLAKAVSLEKMALELTPEKHPERPQRLAELAQSLHSRSRDCQNPDLMDLTEAISLEQKALEMMPDDHPSRARLCLSLGVAFHDKYLSDDGTGDDFLASASHFKSAATSTFSPLPTRFESAKRWASILRRHYRSSPDLLPAFDTTLYIVALIASLERTVQSRYSALEGVSGVALDAATTAMTAGRVDKALEWLEQGRCLVWAQLTDLRTSLDELRAHSPALAHDITTVSQQLDAIGSSRVHSHYGRSLGEKMTLEREAREHQELAQRRDKLIAQARNIPGFDKFLLPPSYSGLLSHLPPSGYVIVVNAHEDRCDAVVLSAEWKEVLHVPLSNFSYKKAKRCRDGLRDGCGRYHLRMRDAEDRGIRPARTGKNPVTTLLKNLWDNLVKPVYDALRLKKIDPMSDETYPRVWWCPTGILSFLPIHAAGVYTHNQGVTCSALDYAIFSYTPSITSLQNRVKNCRPISKGVSGFLMTSQPSPGPAIAPSIPGTTSEVNSVHSRASEEGIRVLKLEGNDVTIEGFLEHMERFSSVHLACHGSQNANDPLASRFLFHAGSLELREIMKKDLGYADLAFLSACQTSTGEEKLADEAVHLAAGMLAAGYRRVIATMWSIGDKEAPQVARDFYDYIFDRREVGDMGGFDGSLSAEALHYAIQRLRCRLGSDNSDRSLLSWAPYVHWGY